MLGWLDYVTRLHISSIAKIEGNRAYGSRFWECAIQISLEKYWSNIWIPVLNFIGVAVALVGGVANFIQKHDWKWKFPNLQHQFSSSTTAHEESASEPHHQGVSSSNCSLKYLVEFSAEFDNKSRWNLEQHIPFPHKHPYSFMGLLKYFCFHLATLPTKRLIYDPSFEWCPLPSSQGVFSNLQFGRLHRPKNSLAGKQLHQRHREHWVTLG